MEIIGSNVLDIDGHSSIEINAHSIVYRNEVDEEGYDLEDNPYKLADRIATIQNKWKFSIDLELYVSFIKLNSKGEVVDKELEEYMKNKIVQ